MKFSRRPRWFKFWVYVITVLAGGLTSLLLAQVLEATTVAWGTVILTVLDILFEVGRRIGYRLMGGQKWENAFWPPALFGFGAFAWLLLTNVLSDSVLIEATAALMGAWVVLTIGIRFGERSRVRD
jgi:hypothetical protein